MLASAEPPPLARQLLLARRDEATAFALGGLTHRFWSWRYSRSVRVALLLARDAPLIPPAIAKVVQGGGFRGHMLVRSLGALAPSDAVPLLEHGLADPDWWMVLESVP